MDLKPGLSVRIVTELDATKERIRVKSSTIYDVEGQTAILAQTDPPVLRSMLSRNIVVTYLFRKNEVMVRHGFPARILEFMDYSLSSGRTVKALKVEKTGEAGPYSIRMSYRVAPTTHSKLSVTICGTPVNVIDISLGGARFSYDKSLRLQEDEVLGVRVEMDGSAYELQGRLLRTWNGMSEGLSHDLRFASMEFVKMDKSIERALSQKLQDIERESLRREMRF